MGREKRSKFANDAKTTADLASSLAQSMNQRENHYYVGVNQKYKTITSAVNQWIAEGRPKATIHILAGTYKETLTILNDVNNPYKLSFIGENKKDVIWKSTIGYYKDAPLHYQGEGIIKGITFIADHSENPSYAYSALSGNVWTDNVGGAYALHVDFEGAGTTLIQDCDIISYQNAGLGSGTSKNQTIRLENVNVYSYTDNVAGSSQQLANGAILYHTAAKAGAENQIFSMVNVNAFSEKSHAFTLTDSSPDLITSKQMEFINVNFASNTITTRTLLWKYNAGAYSATTGVPITKNCYGNNVERFNYVYANDPIKPLALTDITGKAMTITDWNNAYYGFIIGDGNALNAPLGGIYFMGYAITYDNSSYTIQYAYQITSNFELYKRTKSGSTWSTWTRCWETSTELRTSLQKNGTTGARITGLGVNDKGYFYFDTTLNKPIWWDGAGWKDSTGTAV
jgi:hypothetical protein